MKSLRVMACAFLAVALLGACYVTSMVLGWFMALLSAAGMVFLIVGGILLFLTKLCMELWESRHDSDE